MSSCCFVFTINDSYGDGICCSYGEGSVTVTVDGSDLDDFSNGGDFLYTASTPQFCITESVRINIVPDNYPTETSWTLTNPDGGVVQEGSGSGIDVTYAIDDLNCSLPGCTNPAAYNYSLDATDDDGSCNFACTNASYTNYDFKVPDNYSCITTNTDTCDCGSKIEYGCTDSNAEGYNAIANVDDGSCIYSCPEGTVKAILNISTNKEEEEDEEEEEEEEDYAYEVGWYITDMEDNILDVSASPGYISKVDGCSNYIYADDSTTISSSSPCSVLIDVNNAVVARTWETVTTDNYQGYYDLNNNLMFEYQANTEYTHHLCLPTSQYGSGIYYDQFKFYKTNTVSLSEFVDGWDNVTYSLKLEDDTPLTNNSSGTPFTAGTSVYDSFTLGVIPNCPPPSSWNYENTKHNHSILFSDSISISEGYIGAFYDNNTCAGYTYYKPGYSTALSVRGNDSESNNGFANNITFKLYNCKSTLDLDLGDIPYTEDGITQTQI